MSLLSSLLAQHLVKVQASPDYTTTGGGGPKTYATSANVPLTNNSVGDLAFVSDVSKLYVWIGAVWYNIPTNSGDVIELFTPLAATGGTVTTVGNYKIHTFTTSDILSVSSLGNKSAEILIVAGGGSGGPAYNSGGGGAGAVLYNAEYNFSLTGDYAITVGAGGAGGATGPHNGSNSVFDFATAIGGGSGGNPGTSNGSAGGSGGGGAGLNGNSTGILGGASNQGAVTGFTVYGNAGGNGSVISGVPYGAGGGGGGAGAAGTSTGDANGGAGGTGIINPIVGSTIGQLVTSDYWIGGGGGGGVDSGYTAGAGGQGGGGRGYQGTSPVGQPGTVNTGGGGGGSTRFVASSGQNGGSGVVIIKYRFQ